MLLIKFDIFNYSFSGFLGNHRESSIFWLEFIYFIYNIIFSFKRNLYNINFSF